MLLDGSIDLGKSAFVWPAMPALLRLIWEPRSQVARRPASRRRSTLPTEQHPADRARSNKRARLLTPGFSLARHLATFGALVALGLTAAGWLLRRAHPRDLWIVPIYLMIANLTEYFVHRVLMHRPLWPRALYQGHTLGHHRAFQQGSMAIDAWREMELVLMPALTIGVFFLAIGPVVAVVAWIFGQGAAGFFLLTAIATFLGYEGLHALYHLPAPVLARTRVSGNPLFALLERHHRHHHRLARMRWANFNISMPLSDRLFGTFESERRWLEARAASQGVVPQERASDQSSTSGRSKPRR
jgi:hypothetical protein